MNPKGTKPEQAKWVASGVLGSILCALHIHTKGPYCKRCGRVKLTKGKKP